MFLRLHYNSANWTKSAVSTVARLFHSTVAGSRAVPKQSCSRLPLDHNSRFHAVPPEVVSDSETMQILNYSGCYLNVHTSHTRMY